MIRKEGKIPCNCRFDIDYREKTPKVKFGYTSKTPTKDAVNQGSSPYIFFGLAILIVLLPYVFITNYAVYEDYPKDCVFNFINHTSNYSFNYSSNNLNYGKSIYAFYIYGLNVTCDTGNYYLPFDSKKTLFTNSGFKELEDFRILLLLTILFGLFGLTFLINNLLTRWLITKKWYQKWLPVHNAGGKGRKKKYLKFKPKDVYEKTIVIPRFSNVELDYKTGGDFSNQLKHIRVREYRNKFIKKGKVSKKDKVNNFKWYAIFYFKENPKDGYLEVIYQ